MSKNALVVVDVQNDFLPGGALAVGQANEILPVINRLLVLPFDVKVASQDWHPLGHCSFASSWNKKPGARIMIGTSEQILWPDHCVQNSHGAALSQALNARSFDVIIQKGTDPHVDSYSAFFDNKKEGSTGLDEYLKAQKIKDLYFTGLATEYCVYNSVMDALSLGYSVHLILDGCRGVELKEGDIAQALAHMKEKGAEFLNAEQAIKRLS